MKRGIFNKFGKGFIPPFVDPYFYKSVTYDDFFKAVEKQIRDKIYQFTYRAEHVKLRNNTNLTKVLKYLVPICPDLFNSDSPDARKLVAHFGRLVNTSLHAQNSKEREKARNTIKDILDSRTPDTKWKKVHIPIFLSLNNMRFYLHKITKHLKGKLPKYRRPQEWTDFKNFKDDEIDMLKNQPMKFTEHKMAEFFGCSLEKIRKDIKEEKRYLNSLKS